MKILAINGGPRKGWNTHMLLESALEGARSAGAETQLINLYDFSFKGCVSCFACKRRGKTVEICAYRDALTPALEAFRGCDGFILGTPVYFWRSTGMTHSFIERALFPYASYEDKPSSFPKKIKTAYIYTMNVSEEQAETFGYTRYFENNRRMMESIIGPCETLMSTETLQFADYGDYAVTRFDGEERKKRRETVFPEDLKKAFALGVRIAGQ